MREIDKWSGPGLCGECGAFDPAKIDGLCLNCRSKPKMTSVEIEIGEELGRFNNHAQWVNHAKRVYQQAYEKIGSKDIITLDSAIPRRVMLRGLQFNTAEKDCTFPAVIYAIK